MFRLIKNGETVALGDNLRYIRKQENGSYGFCTREKAQGIAVDSVPYHLEGMNALDGAENVTMEPVEAGTIVMDMAAASAVYASVADAGGITEAEMSMHPDLFPRMKGDSSLIKQGKHINWCGTIKRAKNDLWDTEENNPDNAPTLWEDILYRDGIRIIPETITATTAFSEGELGWWGDVLYRSIYQGSNVWTPEAYPAAWTKVE